jgi:hypothetical protein
MLKPGEFSGCASPSGQITLLSPRTGSADQRKSIRVPCTLTVHLLLAEKWMTADAVDIGDGGLRLWCLTPLAVGERADVELPAARPDSPVYIPRSPAVVGWVRPRSDFGYDCGLAFVSPGEAERRQLRRMVLELLRHLPLASAAAS